MTRGIQYAPGHEEEVVEVLEPLYGLVAEGLGSLGAFQHRGLLRGHKDDLKLDNTSVGKQIDGSVLLSHTPGVDSLDVPAPSP